MVDLLAKAKAAALFALDIIVPRFITEDVAVRRMAGGNPQDWSSFEIACCMEEAAANVIH